jgi:putative DNA primase/helicase
MSDYSGPFADLLPVLPEEPNGNGAAPPSVKVGDTAIALVRLMRTRAETMAAAEDSTAQAHAAHRLECAETDMGNARRLVNNHRKRLRYVPGMGWLAWDVTRWARDSDGETMRLAKQTVRGIELEAAAMFETAVREPDEFVREKALKTATARLAHAKRSQSQPRLDALLTCASTEKPFVAHADQLDADPWLLNTVNGTVNLRTGELRAHDPADLITKITAAELNDVMPTPHWLEYLRTSLGDPNLIACFQRRVGYTLTGDTSEQCLFLVAGDGENGKTTGMETIAAMLGDYATAADASTFTTVASDRAARSDLARLRGARLVTADEIDAGATLAESLVKRLTGGDRITARYLYRDEFEFRPVMTLWVTVNHLPQVQGDDHAIWRRLQVIPFDKRIQRPDKHLSRKLRVELPGILAWALQGCLDWQRHGLDTCGAIEQAGAAYRQREDRLALFLGERCELDAAARVDNGELRDAYHAWEHARGSVPMHDLFDRLEKRGFAAGKSNGRRVRKGLRLVSTDEAGTGRDG